jgi:hypothetical protein
MTNNQLGLTPHLTSSAGPLTKGDLPSNIFGKYEYEVFEIVGYVIDIPGLIIVPVCFLVGIFGCIILIIFNPRGNQASRKVTSFNYTNTQP